jgi:hypothetical protein
VEEEEACKGNNTLFVPGRRSYVTAVNPFREEIFLFFYSSHCTGTMTLTNVLLCPPVIIKSESIKDDVATGIHYHQGEEQPIVLTSGVTHSSGQFILSDSLH